MSYDFGQAAAGTGATYVFTVPAGVCRVVITPSAAGTITVGGSAVTAANGAIVPASGLVLEGFPGSRPVNIYAIGTGSVSWAISTPS